MFLAINESESWKRVLASIFLMKFSFSYSIAASTSNLGPIQQKTFQAASTHFYCEDIILHRIELSFF